MGNGKPPGPDILYGPGAAPGAGELCSRGLGPYTAPAGVGPIDLHLLREHLDFAGAILVAINTEEQVTLVNRKACELLERREEDIVGENWFETFLPAGTRDRMRATFHSILAGEAEFLECGEDVVVTRSGEERVVSWHNTVMRDGDGRVTGTLSSGEDITERRRAEDALRSSEMRFTALAEVLQVIVWMISPDWSRVEYVNPAFEVVYGYRSSELYDRPELWTEVIHPQDRDRVLAEIEAQRGKPMQLEYRIVRADGRVRWIRDVTSPIRGADGETLHVAGFAEDVTERKEARDALQMSRAFLRAAIDSLPFDFFAIETNGTYALQNAACRELWGDVLGKGPDAITADDSTLALWASNNARAFRGETVDEEVSYAVEGSTRHYRNIVAPIRQDGEVHAILGINIDISERRRVELALEESLREKEVLLREIQHRIKNNLQVVTGLLELQADAFERPRHRELFRDLLIRVRSMGLVHEALCASESVERVAMPRFVETIVEHLVRAYPVRAGLEPTLLVADVEVSMDVAIPCGLIIGELISNALKHAFPMGRRTAAGTSHEIRVELDRSAADRLRLVVADSGVGMPPAVNWHDSPSIGLQLVDSLIRQLDGNVTVDSRGGTSITVEFGG